MDITKHENFDFIFLYEYVVFYKSREDIVLFCEVLLSKGYYCDEIMSIVDALSTVSLKRINSLFRSALDKIDIPIPSMSSSLAVVIKYNIIKASKNDGSEDGAISTVWKALEIYKLVNEGDVTHVFDLDDLLNEWLERLYFRSRSPDDYEYRKKLSTLASNWLMKHDDGWLDNSIREICMRKQ